MKHPLVASGCRNCTETMAGRHPEPRDGGPTNALVHCTMSCCLAKASGDLEWARDLMSAHENDAIDETSTPEAIRYEALHGPIDDENNSLGFFLSTVLECTDDVTPCMCCYAACWCAHEHGGLAVLPP